MDIGCLLGSRGRGGTKAEIERETKRSANSRNTVNDIGAIDRAAVPGIGGGMGGFDKHSVGASIIGSDANSFVEEPMEVLDTNGFVVATGSHMDIDMQK